MSDGRPYIKEIPACPLTDYEYNYTAALSPDNFTLYCKGWTHREIKGDNNIYFTPGTGIIYLKDPSPTRQEDGHVKKCIMMRTVKMYMNSYMPFIILALIGLGVIVVIMIVMNLFQKK